MATEPEIQETRNVNTTQLALAAGGVLLLLVVLWFAFLRGGDDPTLETAPAPPPVEGGEPVLPVDPVDPGDDDGPGQGPVETFEVFAPRDPFDPLIEPATDPGTGTPPTDGGVDADGDGQIDPGTGTGDGTGTGTGDGTGTGTGTGDGTGNGGGGENVGGHRVSLVDVFRAEGGRRAQVQVDGTVYTVEEGDRFAESFQLLSISGECATMLFGDDQFTLCEGEEILK